jgi:hypothetical protein
MKGRSFDPLPGPCTVDVMSEFDLNRFPEFEQQTKPETG